MRLELSQVPMSPLSELTSDHPAVSDTGEIMQKTHTAADNRSSAGTVRLMTIVSDLILALELTRQAAVIIIAPAYTGAPVIRLTILPAADIMAEIAVNIPKAVNHLKKCLNGVQPLGDSCHSYEYFPMFLAVLKDMYARAPNVEKDITMPTNPGRPKFPKYVIISRPVENDGPITPPARDKANANGRSCFSAPHSFLEIDIGTALIPRAGYFTQHIKRYRRCSRVQNVSSGNAICQLGEIQSTGLAFKCT